eukprot:CAMPEP_0185030698 /NCGR_PEP_ID=MMETSP1103-20130426/17709_1 /TAXON_ID=36769 /ORGANISM="Paraphysomonas bandaiensis, Strain Caron Lab Isolate" /LENGTH=519 /DNA_ID=CAMNT_0027565917 /DNA_START=50 /DNA_END=1609 /DNA_ORIENTATION=+
MTTGLKPQLNGVTARELVNLAKELREHGIRCVQKIAAWTLAQSDDDDGCPKPFMWEGQEYLVKMMTDLDFIAENLPASMKQHGGFAVSDPFFATRGLGDASFKRASTAATLVVLDACARRKAQIILEEEAAASCQQSVHSEESEMPRESVRMGHIRRRGVTDVYKSNMREDDSGHDERLNPTSILLRKHEKENQNVIFRGRKLYRRGKILGAGAYAKVYDCERQDGVRFAVKVFDLNINSMLTLDEEAAYTKKCYHRELSHLKNLSHDGIISLEEGIIREGVPYIVTEKMSCTLLDIQVDRTSSAPYGCRTPIEVTAISVLEQLSGALAYMHSKHIIHRDIKPENVLVNRTVHGITAKICDLGSAVKLPSKLGETSFSMDYDDEGDLTHYVGSRWYRAPETLGCSTDYSFPADIWSLGCTISEFVTGDALFQGETEQEVLDSILSLFPDHQLPAGMATYFLDRNLEIKSGVAKRTFHSVLSTVSSAFRKVVQCMVCLEESDRYSASGINSDVRELLMEA